MRRQSVPVRCRAVPLSVSAPLACPVGIMLRFVRDLRLTEKKVITMSRTAQRKADVVGSGAVVTAQRRVSSLRSSRRPCAVVLCKAGACVGPGSAPAAACRSRPCSLREKAHTPRISCLPVMLPSGTPQQVGHLIAFFIAIVQH